MKTETVKEFLERGGEIKRCPSRKAKGTVFTRAIMVRSGKKAGMKNISAKPAGFTSCLTFLENHAGKNGTKRTMK